MTDPTPLSLLPEARTEMAKACEEFLTAYRTGKMDWTAFMKAVLSLGVHQKPRNFYWTKWREAQDGFTRAKELKDSSLMDFFLRKISYWKSDLDAWDHWAMRCQEFRVPLRVLEP